MARYEVVVNIKCRSVVDADNEEEAVKEAIKARTDRSILSGTKESVKQIEDTQTHVVIRKITKSMKEVIGNKKFCDNCNSFKEPKGFKKTNYGHECKECAGG